MVSTSRFEKESAKLAKLPRAERFDRLLDFPADFTFKAIGKGSGFWNKVRQVLDDCGRGDVILVERPSARGRYCSITFSIRVENGAAIDTIYTALQTIPELVYLL